MVTEPVQLADGLVYIRSPLAPALYLLMSREFRRRGVAARKTAAKSKRPVTTPEPGADWEDEKRTHDALGFLAASVVTGFAAIEALANEATERLPETFEVKRGSRTIGQADLVRELSTEDKLKKTVPQASGCNAIAGDAALWDRFQRLKSLRDEIVHLVSCLRS